MKKSEEFVQSSCEGKDPLTPGQARRIVKRMRRRAKGYLDSYRCPICGNWHVGTQPRTAVRRKPKGGR